MYKNNEQLKEIYLFETQQMKQYSQLIVTENEMKQLNYWTNLQFKEILFDSDYCSWSIDKSIFNKRINFRVIRQGN